MNNATELSGRLSELVAQGDYAAAAQVLGEAWAAAAGDRREVCALPEHAGTWVRFRDRGYPWRLRRELDAAKNDETALSIILPYVAEWSVRRTDGTPLALPPEAERGPELIGEVDEAVVVWLIHAFYAARAALLSPRPNSSAPSTA